MAAIDLKELGISVRDERLFFIQGDFFDAENQLKLMDKGPYDAVISDAAPSTTGNRTVDAGRSFSLASGIISIADKMLKKGGNLAIKIFQGGDEKELVGMLSETFEKAKVFKPRPAGKNLLKPISSDSITSEPSKSEFVRFFDNFPS